MGLYRRSTWLRPVPTFADLPTPSIDGSVAITLDTHSAWEFESNLGIWVPFPTGGGGGSTNNVFRWSVGTPWSAVYASIITNGGFGVVLVDPDTTPRLMTAPVMVGPTNLNDVIFFGMQQGGLPVRVDMADGVALGANGLLKSKDITWRSLATTTPVVSSGLGGLSFEFDGGGFIGWPDASAITPIIVGVGATVNAVLLRNGATFDGSALTAVTAPALINLSTGATTVNFVATSGSSVGSKALVSSSATASTATLDASSRVSTTAAVAPATLTTVLLDNDNFVFYDDFFVTPQIGANTVQQAIDILKQGVAFLHQKHDNFTPTLGQTIFMLSAPPIDTSTIYAIVDHAVYYPTLDFTVGGPGNQTVTWTNPVVLDPGDSMRIYYFITTPVPQVQDFTPTPGQTVFALSSPPGDPAEAFVILDHAFYYPVLDFTLSGVGLQTLTWVNPVVLDAGDSFRVYF